MKKRGSIFLIVLILIAIFVWYSRQKEASTTSTSSTTQQDTTESLVRAVVTTFGDHLKNVPLSADVPLLTDTIKKEYTPFITPELLSAWLADPRNAPGRPTSSPWPQELEIQSLEKTDPTSYTVSANVIWVTSADLTGNSHPESQAVSLTVIYTDNGWRISSYSQSTI